MSIKTVVALTIGLSVFIVGPLACTVGMFWLQPWSSHNNDLWSFAIVLGFMWPIFLVAASLNFLARWVIKTLREGDPEDRVAYYFCHQTGVLYRGRAEASTALGISRTQMDRPCLSGCLTYHRLLRGRNKM